MRAERMSRGEYIARWSGVARWLFAERVVPLVLGVWGFLFVLLFTQPTGRLALTGWFAWTTLLVVAVGYGVAAAYALAKAHGAVVYSYIWEDSYREPWPVGSDR